jgi:lipoprotein-anchoring transpeptidase ErfK/SrfK
MRRLAVFSALGLATVAALVPVVHGQEEPPPGSTTAPVTTEPPPGTAPEPQPPLPPLLIPDGVTIGSSSVGGLSADQARLVVETAFAQPLEIVHKRLRWLVAPTRLGARARVEAALAQALVAPPGSQVPLVVTVQGQAVHEYVSKLGQRVNREPKDARLRLVKLRPRISEARPGLRVDRYPTVAAIVQALRANERGPVQIETDPVRPEVTAANFGPVVVIRRESKRLFLYRAEKHWRTFRVATGQSAFPTPLGRFSILTMQRNPWWYPPSSSWAEGLEPVPPGPGNPLGTRWMGLSAPLVGIHGTPDAASIGYSASHGCIRMLVSEAEWLFERVRVGTTVFIVRA